MEFRIITGNAKEVETKLNELRKIAYVTIEGMSSTNETTTICVDLMYNDE